MEQRHVGRMRAADSTQQEDRNASEQHRHRGSPRITCVDSLRPLQIDGELS
jgi:hypothetical protein